MSKKFATKLATCLFLVSLEQTYYGSCMQAPMKGCKWRRSAVNPTSAAAAATIIASPAGTEGRLIWIKSSRDSMFLCKVSLAYN